MFRGSSWLKLTLDSAQNTPRDAVGGVEMHTVVGVHTHDGHRGGGNRLGNEIHCPLDGLSGRRLQQDPLQFVSSDQCRLVHR